MTKLTEILRIVFSNGYFMPHGHCYFWTPALVWANVFADGLIAVAYYSIPLSLAWFVRRRKDLPFPWMFLLFGAFIVACGTTHLFEVINVWNSAYGWAAIVKVLTAVLSVATAFLLVRLIPKALTLPSPSAMHQETLTRQEAERQLLQSQEQVLQLQKLESIGQLAGGVAHDFNNLLTGILGTAAELEETLPQNSQELENVREIRKAGERAAALTRQLLAFGRKQMFKPRRLKLNAVVADMTTLLGRLVGENISLQLSLITSEPEVFMDPAQVEQVLVNLVVNARDAMPRGGTLRILTDLATLGASIGPTGESVNAGDYAMLSVTDSGTGIPKDIQPRIFEPFFTTKDLGKGTGLGLSTVYGIVKQNGGDVTVESNEGQGTTFKIYFPLYR